MAAIGLKRSSTRRVVRPGDGFRSALLPAASARAALLARAFVGTQHPGTLFGLSGLEAVPPFGQLERNLAAQSAQPKKIVAGTKSRVLEQAKWSLSGALLESRLQRPRFLDRCLEAPRDR